MFDKHIKLYYELPRYLIGTHDNINLTLLDVCVLGEIMSLSNNEYYCYVSNSMLANIFHVSERQIQKSIKKLEDLRIIKRFFKGENNSCITKNRLIYVQQDVLEQIINSKKDNLEKSSVIYDTCNNKNPSTSYNISINIFP